ncbi:MAG: hypothetical protein C0447_13025 [Methylobacterium sp.]|jgi:hypothetical protein|nr:hypothetical protein [Methylobacterium sp.]
MSLTVNGQIMAEDIFAVKKLDTHRPVYLLVGAIEKIVVKRDNTPRPNDPRNMVHALRNMRAVDRTMATRPLTPNELREIARFIAGEKGDADPFDGKKYTALDELERDLQAAGGVSWVKTSFFEGLINLEDAAAEAREKVSKSGVRAIAAALTAPGGLEKLGAILAIDAFNGNDDRFDFSNQPVVNPGLRRLTNPGNVGLCLQHNVMRPVGMDAYAGAAEFRSLDKAGQPDRGWSGYRLKDDQRGWRQRFCEEVAADIETMLGPRNRKILFAATNRLPKNAGQRLATGMDQGIAKLKATLRTIGDPRRAPPGLIGRMVALGWANPAPPPGLPRR